MSLSNFKLLSKLGSGAYSSVYKVERLADNKIYALKKVSLNGLSEKEKQNALNQVRILASIRHANVIGYRQAFFDEGSNSLCIIMQFADNGDLFQKIGEKMEKKGSFTQLQVWNVLIQIVRGLKALHQRNVLHRDLKSANVFLNVDNKAKLGDMNVSKISQKGLCRTQTGTPYYASPEVWKDKPYGPKSDIWSLGCVIYEMITLHPPFQAEDMEGLYKKVTTCDYQKIPLKYSSDLNDLIRLLLQVDPLKRPSCQKILSMKIVTRRMNDQNTDGDYENPEFLQTIRMPQDSYFLGQHLPKPNYFSPKLVDKKKMSQNKTEKSYNHSQSSRMNIFPRVRGKQQFMHNRSVLIKNSNVVEAARAQIGKNNSKNQYLLERRIKKQKTQNLGTIKNNQKKTITMEQKIDAIQKIYRDQRKQSQKG